MPERAGFLETRAVLIVGGGSIGVSWAIVFARGGCRVILNDSDAARLELALTEVDEKLAVLERAGLIDEPAEAVAARISPDQDLRRAAAEAGYLQECIPERLDLKRALLARIESLVDGECIVASSSSALLPSQLFGGLASAQRMLVVHPANPPHLLPVVELVPGPDTSPATVDVAHGLLEKCGMSPVRVAVEVEGFVYNRLQGALLREAYALVRDGVTDVEGVDRTVREGLGRRWAVVGPFETVDLNTRGGISAHAERMGPAYERMGAERGQHDPWTPDLVRAVTGQRRAQLPLEQWDARVRWRDEQLVAQERARRASEA